MQEVDQPSGMDPWDCAAAFSASAQLPETPVPDMAQLLRKFDAQGLSGGRCQDAVGSKRREDSEERVRDEEQPAAVRSEAVQQQRDGVSDGATRAADEGRGNGRAATVDGDGDVKSTFGKAVKAQHSQYVALCEYIGALSCRISPQVIPELGLCGTAAVKVFSWTGLIAGNALGSLVETCRTELMQGNRAWTVVLLHGFRGNPFCWKAPQSDDSSVQRVPGVGVKSSGVGGTVGPGRESVGAVVILPSGALCLMCMSGAGDAFCKF